ncbi:LysE/ArgO family amino acid transporter [Acinetobacter sp. SM34]|uniref:LysE/ArgO family amino acid transporter n=1 Tax=Acinetobacter sp. SM34 TaxID=1301620 RepID=UPI001EDB5569|nr:LysE/ArgO family amino acid transporter [Acinetobacter sp. SM34]MCG2607213.1 LysE/ArgO family amino acid transporter [Acinetobacter sp. SM34]
MLNSALHGFAMALSLIVVIGAQNAFVLKQGIKQQHIFAVCLCCALSDAILISVGVLGFSELVLLHPDWLNIAKYLGATFLLIYGAQHFYQAWKGEQRLDLTQDEVPCLWKVLLICLGLTWLNPHVYLDTVVLLGSVSTQYPNTQLYFALGAISASFLFFFSLGYAARYLQPIFQRPQAWKILDLIIGCVMWSIAISLLK